MCLKILPRLSPKKPPKHPDFEKKMKELKHTIIAIKTAQIKAGLIG